MKKLLIAVGILIAAVIIFYTGCRIWMKSDFNKICSSAVAGYGVPDRAEALMLLIGSDSESLDAKNHAIWALGHLRGAEGALPGLLPLRTGKECVHSKYVCQRELNRTISYLDHSGINLVWFN